MGKFGSQSSSSSSSGSISSSSSSIGADSTSHQRYQQQREDDSGSTSSGATDQEWKTVENVPTSSLPSSPRRSKKPSAVDSGAEEGGEIGSDQQPSEASTDVSSSSGTTTSSSSGSLSRSSNPPEATNVTDVKEPSYHDRSTARDSSESDGSNDTEESDADSKSASSHEKSNVETDNDGEESETESIRMRRILYDSANTNPDESNNERSGQLSSNDNNNDSLSSIGGPGTGTARRAIIPDTVEEIDEEQTDEGDLGPLHALTSQSQSQSESDNAPRSLATSSRSTSSYLSPSQTKSSFRSGSVSRSSSRTTPPGSPNTSQPGSTTPSSQRSNSGGSKYASQSSRSTATTPLSPQQSTSQHSVFFVSDSQQSPSSSSRSNIGVTNHTGTNSDSTSKSTRSGPDSRQEDEAASGRSASTRSKATQGNNSRQSSSPDPPESQGSSRSGLQQQQKKQLAVDHEEEKLDFGDGQDDLNDSIKSKEDILQRLRKRRKGQPAKNRELEHALSEKVSRPPPGKELARDPSGDLRSFTGEYETENDSSSGDPSDSNYNAEGWGEHIEDEAKQQLKQPTDRLSSVDRRHSDSRDKAAKQTSGHESESSLTSPKDALPNPIRDRGNETDGQSGAARIVTKSESVGEGAKPWDPMKEKLNTPLTLHKLGSHDTDDWKPPALTTYGEQKYIPASRKKDEGRKDPDASDHAGEMFQNRAPSPNTLLASQHQPSPDLPVAQGSADRLPYYQQERKEKADEMQKPRPPVHPPYEISLISSLDDDSSLGTYGTYLERFPKESKKKEKLTKPTVVPRFAQEDSIAGGHEVKSKTEIATPFVQEDSITGRYEMKKIVPRFAQGDSVAGGHEVNKKLEGKSNKSLVPLLRFVQGDPVAFANETTKDEKQDTFINSEGSIPRFVGGGNPVHEVTWGDRHLLTQPQQKEANDDYYKSWIHIQPGDNVNSARQDPPEVIQLFPFNPKVAIFENEDLYLDAGFVSSPFTSELNREALNSSSWVPQEKKLEVKRSDSIPSLPVHPHKSERSTSSVWVAPGMSTRSQDDVDVKARRMYIDSIMASKRFLPVGQNEMARSRSATRDRSVRVDYTGAITYSSHSKSSSSPSNSFLSGPSVPTTSGTNVPITNAGEPSTISLSQTSQSPKTTKISGKSSSSCRLSPFAVPPESKTPQSTEEIDETRKKQSKIHNKVPYIATIAGSSQHMEVVNQVSRTPSHPNGNPTSSGKVQSPEHPLSRNDSSPVQQNDRMTKPTAPYMSNTTIIAILAAAFFVVAAVGVVIYFFVVPLFQERRESPQAPTSTPAPTIDTSLEGLKNLILDASPDTRPAFDTLDSPQSLALDWLSKNQLLATYTSDQVLQRFVMSTLYFSTGGESWKKRDLWLSDSDECEWWSSETQSDACNESGQIDKIDLEDNGLSGSLPWNELAILGPQLLILEIFANQVSGSLSSTVGKLTSLIVLDLQRNGFTGTIPGEFEQLQALRHLILAENEFSGTIPSELTEVSGLESLSLSDNSFEGSIPDELNSMSALRNAFLVS
jgi:hypothetical protein